MPTTVRELLLELGIAELAAGRPVHEVEAAVCRVGAALGAPDVRSAATPTGIFVSLGGSESVGFASVGPMLRFDQAARVEALTGALLAGELDAEAGLTELRAVRAMPPRLRRSLVALALLPQAAGVALVLQPTVASALAATAAALVVAGLDLVADRAQVLRVLTPVLAAFAAGCLVFAAARLDLLDAPLRTALAPIAVLLPGALIVTGMSEVTAGAMVAGAARLAFGAVQVLLLSFGLFLAARVVGIGPDELANTRLDDLGVLATVAGVLLVGVGVYVHLSAPPGALPWLLLVLIVTAVVQAIGQEAGGPVLGGFVGGVAAAFTAAVVNRLPHGPPQLAIFLPAFWLLVPGSLGVLSATELAAHASTGFATVTAAIAAIIAIALGVLVGSAVGASRR
ncbi:uncharacterized membrane protein YjjP (DUF1212 family) [Solirubrobacter pauli]|uniref:Uncharacterized membrane protein YjjP (DUF1212 family) n=1 Tax=Solirubrobacter pauli TaxID=166793 RepID=A0A660KWH6_9ACTN|nr:threonine/serine exporter family protein [Solirubrobacter pauli]RKQ84795.1 uncharacterized membrane protein YjjP (DUF1212 family) [Solirubrobacter pauli]